MKPGPWIVILALALAAGTARAQEVRRVDRDDGCTKCHEEAREEIRESVHARSKVGCVACHGADDVNTAQSRGNPHRRIAGFRMHRIADVPADCGSCHRSEFEAFKPSGHFKATLADASDPRRVKGCIECHSPHKTTTARRKPLFADCHRCHDAPTPEFRQGMAYLNPMDTLEVRADDLERRIGSLERSPGISTASARRAHQSASAFLREAAIRQHGLKFPDFAAPRDQSSALVEAAYNSLSGQEQAFRGRWLKAAPFWALLLLSLVLVRIKGRRLRKESSP